MTPDQCTPGTADYESLGESVVSDCSGGGESVRYVQHVTADQEASTIYRLQGGPDEL